MSDEASDLEELWVEDFRRRYAAVAREMAERRIWAFAAGVTKGVLTDPDQSPRFQLVEGPRILALGRSDFYDSFMARFEAATGRALHQSDRMVWIEPRDPYRSLGFFIDTAEEIHFSLEGVSAPDFARCLSFGRRAESRRDLATPFMTVWEINQVLFTPAVGRCFWHFESPAQAAEYRAAASAQGWRFGPGEGLPPGGVSLAAPEA